MPKLTLTIEYPDDAAFSGIEMWAPEAIELRAEERNIEEDLLEKLTIDWELDE